MNVATSLLESRFALQNLIMDINEARVLSYNLVDANEQGRKLVDSLLNIMIRLSEVRNVNDYNNIWQEFNNLVPNANNLPNVKAYISETGEVSYILHNFCRMINSFFNKLPNQAFLDDISRGKEETPNCYSSDIHQICC